MKRWTLLLFLLLLPFTMAPRMSLTPGADNLDVVLVVSRTDVKAGDRVTVVGQVTNVGDAAVPVPEIGVVFAGKATVARLGKGCVDRGGGVHCTLRALKPGQQRTFSFSLATEGGDVILSAGLVGTTQAGTSEPVTIHVETPNTGTRG